MSKVILVTGANSGIGYELVKLLGARPDVEKVYLGARNRQSGEDAVRTIVEQEGIKNVKFLQIDVTDPESIESASKTIAEREGRLDVLVNNAGIGEMEKDQNPTTIDIDIIRRLMETNVCGLIQTTKALLPLLRKSPHAAIVNLSSDMASNTIQASDKGFHGITAYSMSKVAVNSYTISLAHELKKDGIKVNAVTPGFTATKFTANFEGGKSPKTAAEALVPWALVGSDGPTGRFIDAEGNERPW